MRIFITGGTGFIGRPTLAEFKKRGHHLLVLSRKKHRERGVEFIKGELSDIPRLEKQLKKFEPETAVHLAWEGIPDFSYRQCVKNLEEGLRFFHILAKIGCKKIVAAGSGFECGNHTGRVPDDIDVKPVSMIVAAKHSLHIIGEVLAREKRMDFIWLRPFTPYGPGQRLGSLIPHIMRSTAGNIPLRLKNPLAQGDFIYVDDVGQAIAAAALRGKGHATYNVGSGRLTSVRDIAKIVCEEMDVSEAYYRDFSRTAKGRLAGAPYAELKNIRKAIGWRPTTSIKLGIQKTIDNYNSSRIKKGDWGKN